MICEGLGGSSDALNSSALSSASLLLNAARVLETKGKLMLISLHPPLLLSRLVTAANLGFENVSIKVIKSKSTDEPCWNDDLVDVLSKGEFTLLVAERSSQHWRDLYKSDLVMEVAAEHAAVFDYWFTRQHPMLTNDRSELLAQRWPKANEMGDIALPLQDAFQLMFTDDERSEYTLEYFLEDVKEFENNMASPNTLSLSEAEVFIQMNQ